MQELQILFLHFLLLDLSQLLLLHSLDNLQLFLLLYPVLVLIPLLHDLLHVVVDVFVEHLKLV